MIKPTLKRKSAPAKKSVKRAKPVIGWREWAALPELRIAKIKVKIDTGAKTSSLHALDVVIVKRQGKKFVRFKVHPLQRNTRRVVECESELVEWRQVTDSGGKRTLRPVIETKIMLGAKEVMAEVTLIARDQMGFRMLIGRQALRKTWLIDPSRSYIAADDVEVLTPGSKVRRLDEEE